MRSAKIFFDKKIVVGTLTESNDRKNYIFEYDAAYKGPPLSLTLPSSQKVYSFDKFPPFFDGVLPEGMQLEALLRLKKLDKNDYFGQLMCVGRDLVGAFSVEEVLA